MAEDHLDDCWKWYRWAYEQRYGKGSWETDRGVGIKKGNGIQIHGFQEFHDPFKTYWNDELAVGILEQGNKFIGVACLVAKEVVDKEGFVEKFGLGFGGDVHWKAAPVLLDHLSRSPMSKAILVTFSKLPFKIEPDIPEELEGRLNWAKRKLNIKQQEQSGTIGGVVPNWLPKQMKEEEDHARYFLESMEGIEAQIQEHLKPYFLIKENLMAIPLFLYVYTNPHENIEDAINEILARKRAAKIEANETYFVKCSDVRDPLIVFNPEFFPSSDDMRKYSCIALTKDVVGFEASYSVASVIRKMFSSALELPREEPIEEQIHIPNEEVSIPKSKSAFLGYVVSSIIKKKVTKRRVHFPLDILTGHGIIYGKTRVGKSFFSLILIQEAMANGVKVVVFDPHGTLANRLKPNDLLKVVFRRGKADITDELEEISQEASN